MPLGTAINSLRLLLMNLDEKKSTKNVIKTSASKTKIFDTTQRIKYLKRSEPEKHGYTKEYIDSFINEINSDLSLRANRLLIVKDNEVIGEQYLHPYVKNCWDGVFSATKTMTALALGLLYDEGKVDLDVPVVKILEIEKNVTIARNKKITLRHLLTMTTGSNFNEASSAASLKWTYDFFNSGYKFKLGTKFEYNSMNSYIIGVVVEKLAGCPMDKLLQDRIFSKLDMNETFFEKSNEGHLKCGWGFFILPEDMAKLGVLVMNRGVYNGERLISKEWIDMMSHTQFKASDFAPRYDYGFQMWTNEENNFACFNGMYDQNIMLFRNSGVVLVTCFADSEAFHGANLFPIAEKYFASAKMKKFPLCETKGNRVIKNNSDLNYYYDKIANRNYISIDDKSQHCGILPLLLQNEMGTYSKGIKYLRFNYNNGEYSLSVKEGHKVYTHPFNFEEGVRQTCNFYGNTYECSFDAKFILSGKGEPYLVIRVYFLEFSCVRYISVKFGKDLERLSVEMSETPSLGFIMSVIDVQDDATKKFVGGILKGINPAIVQSKTKNILSPIFICLTENALKNEKR